MRFLVPALLLAAGCDPTAPPLDAPLGDAPLGDAPGSDTPGADVPGLDAPLPDGTDPCAGRTCGGHGTCVPATGACACDLGWLPAGGTCVEDAPGDCAPNRWVTPDAAGGGDGSMGSPWTLAEAMERASAGDHVEVAPGVYRGAATGDRYLPTFRPAQSGTAEAPIVFCARYPAALHEDAPELWSNLENDGPVAGDAACSPAFGVARQSHVIWDGFAVDQADAPWRPDTAPVTLWEATDVIVRRARIVARERPFYDNNNGVRIDASDHVAITDNRILCPHDDADPSNDPGGIQSYDSAHYEWAHNEIVGCATGFHPKGVHEWAALVLVPGSIHHNLVIGTESGVYVQAFPGNDARLGESDHLDIYQNVFRDGYQGITFNPIGNLNGRRVRVVNNTFIGMDADHGVGVEIVSDPGAPAYSEVLIRNNVFAEMAGAYGFHGGDEAMLLGALGRMDFDRARFFDLGALVAVTDHVVFAGVVDTLPEWQARGEDGASTLGDPGFVDAATRDVHLSATSPCRGAGVDVLGLLGGATTASIDLGAYVTDGDQIGIRGAP